MIGESKPSLLHADVATAPTSVVHHNTGRQQSRIARDSTVKS
jgi:hypothetical protein